MKKTLNNAKNMYSAVQAVILYYLAIWTGYVPFETANTSFNDTVGDIDTNVGIQKALLKGFAKAKKEKKREMAEDAMITCKKVRAFAKATGNTSLFGLMKITFSKIFYAPSNAAVTFANNILTAANDMTAPQRTEYNITAGEITALTTVIGEFQTIISSPRDMIVKRKTATSKIAELFETGNGILKDELDNLMSNYMLSNPEFFSDYFNARIVIDLMTHTAIEGNVTAEGGADLNKVKVTLTGRNKITDAQEIVFQEMTNKDGNYIRRELNPELDWDVTFKLDTFNDVTVPDVELIRGKHEKLNVVMVKTV